MKKILIVSLILSAGLVAGCKTTESSGSASAASSVQSGLNTADLVAAFKNADAETVRVVQEVVGAVSKKEWSAASASLQRLQKIPGLTAAQADAVKNLLASVSGKN